MDDLRDRGDEAEGKLRELRNGVAQKCGAILEAKRREIFGEAFVQPYGRVAVGAMHEFVKLLVQEPVPRAGERVAQDDHHRVALEVQGQVRRGEPIRSKWG